VIPFAQGVPPMAALAKEITLFAIRAFKTGRQLEDALEAAFDAIAGMPPHPNGPKGQGKDGDGSAGQVAMAQAHQHDSDVSAQAEMRGDQLDFMIKEQANAIKMRQVEGDLALKTQQLAHSRQESAIRLGMDHDRAVSEEALRAARVSSISAKGAAGLV
jgi:hypothetical protein